MATKKKAPKKAIATTKIPKIDPEPVEIKGAEVEALIFKADRPLTPGEFKTLSNMLKHEQEATGLKIVLIPYSAKVEI